eukprot:920115_1
MTRRVTPMDEKSHVDIPCHTSAQETPDECSEAGREKITLKPVESIPLTPEALQKKREREILDKLVRFEPDVSKRPVPILTQLFPTGTSITLRPILPSITTSASESAWGRHISTLWTLSWRISRRTRQCLLNFTHASRDDSLDSLGSGSKNDL